MKLVSQKDREKKKKEWEAMRNLKKLMAAYDYPCIPNPEVTKKKVSEKV